jgi:hypothetical protein
MLFFFPNHVRTDNLPACQFTFRFLNTIAGLAAASVLLDDRAFSAELHDFNLAVDFIPAE